MGVESSTLRVLWTVVEDMPSHDVFALSDTALIAMLMNKVSRQTLLKGDEVSALYSYIGAKLHLIRDIAAFQSSGSFYLSAS
ncbi:MAG: hypothetical protein VKL39_10890 [Leptolyngbyaceae bacterium]|nr:hypothetical protein [Leptolyngbyaceae bacterium]